MAFNPLEQKGMPLEKQFRSWSELNVDPYDKNTVDPYTRCRVITLCGAEFEAMWFSHQFARHCEDTNIKAYLAMTRRVEQQQQKVINWLIPGNENTLERTLGYEQVAIDLTAWLARNEPHPYVKQAFEFGLLEDFDHMYRYADLMDLLGMGNPEKVVGDYTEIMPGRPTIVEHRHPHDDLPHYIDGNAADPMTVLHVMTLVAAEQQTMNFYMNSGNIPENPLARALYLEIAQIEEQHVSHYESLLDPRTPWLKREVLHQYNECYLYHSFMTHEEDPRIKRLWELHLDMELEHLRLACQLYEKYENADPTAFLPKELPEPVKFQPNKEYIRQVLKDQVDLTADEDKFVPVTTLDSHHRYFEYQEAVNNGTGFVPSERVIQEYIQKKGKDYRLETEGEHPVPKLRKHEPETLGEKVKSALNP